MKCLLHLIFYRKLKHNVVEIVHLQNYLSFILELAESKLVQMIAFLVLARKQIMLKIKEEPKAAYLYAGYLSRRKKLHITLFHRRDGETNLQHFLVSRRVWPDQQKAMAWSGDRYGLASTTCTVQVYGLARRNVWPCQQKGMAWPVEGFDLASRRVWPGLQKGMGWPVEG